MRISGPARLRLVALLLTLAAIGCGDGSREQVGTAEHEQLDEFGLPEVEFLREDGLPKADPALRLADQPDENGMITEVFPVPPGLSLGGDRFSTIQEVVESYGIVFDPGTYAEVYPRSSQLKIRQTPERMEQIRVLLGEGSERIRKGRYPLEIPADAKPDELITHAFTVPPKFLSSSFLQGEERDPFRTPVQRTSKEVLEALGVEFGPGATVTYGGSTSQVIVRQTPEQMRRIASIIDAMYASLERVYRVRLTVVQLSASAAEDFSAGEGDSEKSWELIGEGLEGGTVSLLNEVAFPVRSEDRLTYKDVREVFHLSEFERSDENDGRLVARFESREVGTILKVEPAPIGEGTKVKVVFSLDHHWAPPSESEKGEVTTPDLSDFQAESVEGTVVCEMGKPLLVGSWKPMGEGGEIVVAAFLTLTSGSGL